MQSVSWNTSDLTLLYKQLKNISKTKKTDDVIETILSIIKKFRQNQKNVIEIFEHDTLLFECIILIKLDQLREMLNEEGRDLNDGEYNLLEYCGYMGRGQFVDELAKIGASLLTNTEIGDLNNETIAKALRFLTKSSNSNKEKNRCYL